MERNPDWSRRDLLKTAGTGAIALGLGAAAVNSAGHYVVGTTSRAATRAAISVSDDRHHVVELGAEDTWLGEHGALVSGAYTSGQSQSILTRRDVAFVQPDRDLTLPDPANAGESPAADGQTLPWGIDRIDADVAKEAGETGDGVDVAIIDGGIAASHPDLAPNVAEVGEDNHRAWAECDGDDCDHPWDDDGGHGTHVSGTVAATDSDEGVLGVASEVRLHALKVCSSAGFCTTSDIADAIRFAADQGWDVANLSLGSPEESPALKAAGEYAAKKGLLLVSSAGNSGRTDDPTVGYPASYEEFLAVSATTIEDGLADFSSRGADVDVAAPGASVCSSFVGDGHDVLDGTSMASPHVAGAAALLVADGYGPEEAREQLLETAEDIDLDAEKQGAGLVDAAAALGLDSGDDGTGDGTSCPT